MWKTDDAGVTKRAFTHTHNEIDIDSAAMDSDYPAQMAVYSNTLYYAAGIAQLDTRHSSFSTVALERYGAADSVALSQAFTVEDVDDTSAASPMQYSVEVGATKGFLTLGDVSGLLFEKGDGYMDGTARFSGTLERINAAFRGLQYRARRFRTGADAIIIVVNDTAVQGGLGVALSVSNKIAVHIDAVNNPPTIQLPVLDHVTTLGNPLLLSGISIGDVDASATSIADAMGVQHGAMQLTISAKFGTLSLSSLRGLHFMSGDGISDRSIAVLGSIGDINSAIAALQYDCKVDSGCSVGTDMVTIVINDNGHSGTGGAMVTTKTLLLAVKAA